MRASKGLRPRLLSAGIAAGILGCLLVGQPPSAWALSAVELAKAQANFKAANPNGDTLNPAQFKTFIDLNAAAGIGRAGRIKSNNAYDRAFGILDTDKSGTVTWEEYLKAQ
jgi:hypothetical protein